VPFPIPAKDGEAKIAAADWLFSCSSRFVFLGSNKPVKYTHHQPSLRWTTTAALILSHPAATVT
jgi:hypothetical protein